MTLIDEVQDVCRRLAPQGWAGIGEVIPPAVGRAKRALGERASKAP